MPGLRSDRLSPVKGMGRWKGSVAGLGLYPILRSVAGPELLSSLFLHYAEKKCTNGSPHSVALALQAQQQQLAAWLTVQVAVEAIACV